MTLSGKLRQFLGAAIMSFPKFLFGSGIVWPSYSIIFLKGPDTHLSRPITMMEEALIGSLPLIASFFASPFGGVLVDRFGRKLGGVVTVLTIAFSWVLIACASQVPIVLVARFLLGLSGGTLMQVAWSFTAEVSEDSVRGFMASMPAVMYSLGALISIILGWVMEYRHIVYINLGLACIDIMCMFLIPESPVYLCMIGKEEDSLKSLAFYRAAPADDKLVVDEFNKMKANQAAKQIELTVMNEDISSPDVEKKNLQVDGTTRKKMTGWKYFRLNSAPRWGFVVVMTVMTLSILTGVIAIQIYGGSLFLKAAPSLSPDLCAVLLASVLLIGSVSGASVADLWGRRILLIWAALVNGVCMFGLGSLVKWSWGPEWMVPALILIFCLAFNFGGGSIPYLLIAECFVPEVKAFVQSLGMFTLNLINAILLIAFVPAVELVGLTTVFFAFGLCAVATAVFTFFFLPETKGLNPYEIEKLFESKKSDDN